MHHSHFIDNRHLYMKIYTNTHFHSPSTHKISAHFKIFFVFQIKGMLFARWIAFFMLQISNQFIWKCCLINAKTCIGGGQKSIRVGKAWMNSEHSACYVKSYVNSEHTANEFPFHFFSGFLCRRHIENNIKMNRMQSQFPFPHNHFNVCFLFHIFLQILIAMEMELVT